MRTSLDCDQHVEEAARRLTVHPETAHYRVNRLREGTGPDVRRTSGLVTTWRLLDRRRAPAPPAPPPRPPVRVLVGS